MYVGIYGLQFQGNGDCLETDTDNTQRDRVGAESGQNGSDKISSLISFE